jgi:hypothetical protein
MRNMNNALKEVSTTDIDDLMYRLTSRAIAHSLEVGATLLSLVGGRSMALVSLN